MRSYDVETGAFVLTDLAEETDNELESNASKKNGSVEREHAIPKSGDP